MQKTIKKVLSLVVAVVIMISASINCLAVNVEGSANGGGGGSTQAAGNYGITKNEISGYRFTLIKGNNERATGTISLDVLIRNTTSDGNASSAYRFVNKQPKTYWISNFSANFGINSTYLARNNTNVCHDTDASFNLALSQNSATILEQIKSESNVNKILSALGSSYTYRTLSAGYKILCEPLFVFQGMAGSSGNYAQCCFTVTEIGKYGCFMFGNSAGTESSYNENAFTSIVNYTNGWWPHRLQVNSSICGWTGAPALVEYNSSNGKRPVKHTFEELVKYGYGVAFAYGDPNDITTISVNPSVSIQLQKKSGGNYTDISSTTLLEEGQTYRAKYTINSTDGKSVIKFSDYNGFTDSRTFNNVSLTVNTSGETKYSNDFTITDNTHTADNYNYNSATFNIGASITFDASATATANGVTTATESNTSDNSASITCRYVTYKPTPENRLNDTTGIPDSMKATIENSVNNKNLYSGQIVEAYATYKNNSSFNDKLKYSWKFNFPTYYYTNDAVYSAYNNGTESGYLATNGTVNSDATSGRVYNGSNDLNSTRQVTLTSSAGELTYINATGSSNRTVTDTDVYNVYSTDLVASNIYFTDSEGNMLETVKAGQTVIAHYIFINETKIPVWCTIAVGHDNGAGYEHTETLVIAGNGTASISSMPFTISCMNTNKVCAYASIYLGDMPGDTSYENDGTNNVIRNSLIGETGVIQIETPFIVEKIENNAEYKRGITVVSSYKVKSNACRDYGSAKKGPGRVLLI